MIQDPSETKPEEQVTSQPITVEKMLVSDIDGLKDKQLGFLDQENRTGAIHKAGKALGEGGKPIRALIALAISTPDGSKEAVAQTLTGDMTNMNIPDLDQDARLEEARKAVKVLGPQGKATRALIALGTSTPSDSVGSISETLTSDLPDLNPSSLAEENRVDAIHKAGGILGATPQGKAIRTLIALALTEK